MIDYHLGDLFKSSRQKGWDGLPLLSVTLNDGLVIRKELDRRTETNLDSDEHLLVQKGCIAYNMMRVWQGALGRASCDGLVSPAYVVLKPTKNADSLYAEYLFKTPRIIYLFWAYSYGLTKDRLRLYYNDFSRISVKFPPLPEQKKIAQILSTWDKAITTTEQLLANSQQQKKALMQQLVTGKKRLLDENGVRFSGEWKITKLIQMGKVVSGGTPDTNMAMYWEGDILWLTPTDVTALTGRFVSNTSRKITPAGLLNSSAVLLPKGSLMVCTRATIGALAISTSEICTNQGFKNIIPNEGFNIEFIYYLLQMNTNEMIKKSSGSTFLELSKKDFETLSFSCPFIKEQQKIAAVLSAADTEISTLEKKLACLKDEKKALMQQLLTGKRRVKVDEAVAV